MPLGTYLGWNIMAGGFFKGQMCEFTGAYIPFPKTKAERTANGDPRRSLEERYANHDAYVAAVRAAAGPGRSGMNHMTATHTYSTVEIEG